MSRERAVPRRRRAPAALAAAVLALSGALSFAAELLPVGTRDGVQELLERAARGTRAAEWTRRLCDEVGPRLSGSPGDRAAVAWAQRVMREIGLTGVRAEPVTVPRWKRGEETGEVLAPYRHRLVLTALGGSVPTPVGGLVGELVAVPSLEALDALLAKDPGAVRGKVVFFHRKMLRDSPGNGYGSVVPIRTEGAARAGKAGASGVLIRSVGTSSSRLPHTGAMRYAAGGPRIPAAAVSAPDADLLERLSASGRRVVVRFRLGCRNLPDAVSANVVGEVRGSERPEEVVLLGAHLDSWDLGTGAIDDGAGCGIVLEAARLIAEAPRRPGRTVRVVLFANEENGLAGGREYPRAHAGELPRHVAALEADGGAGRTKGFGWSAGEGAEPVLAAISSLLSPLGASGLRKGGGGADIGPLRASGVPLLSPDQEGASYFDLHHSADDTFDKVDPASLEQTATALSAMAFALADLPEPLPRLPEEAPAARR
ncbi:MAG: peptidase M28 family protein [Acidobacteria bacterium]|nr:MAG: peptidase M28 family protein [Acidobacteriota bacterium]